jgi:predicted AlkP superfamily phosphohydrolase/phosphomutase
VGGDELLSLKKELSEKLLLINDDKGNKMNNIIYDPNEIYSGKFSHLSPDLMIYFDNLLCGVNNDVGNNSLYSWATTKGSDDAGHSPNGIFVMSGNGVKPMGDIGEISILDVVPTILSKFNIELDEDMAGGVIDGE